MIYMLFLITYCVLHIFVCRQGQTLTKVVVHNLRFYDGKPAGVAAQPESLYVALSRTGYRIHTRMAYILSHRDLEYFKPQQITRDEYARLMKLYKENIDVE